MSIDNDRAWNDPPPLFFSSDYKNKPISTKRTLLNKRVAFPLHNPEGVLGSEKDVDSDRKAKTETIPPGALCPPTESNFTVQSSPQTTEESPQKDITDEEMLSVVKSTFEIFLNESTQTSEDDIAGVKRKLVIFTDSWTVSLSTTVKQKMFQLATELSAGNIKAAETLCQSLVVSNTREVTPWMVGVKHIIQSAKKTTPESSDGDQCSEGAQVLDACTFNPDSDLNLTS